MRYTKIQILEKINKAKENISLFYKKDFINYRGRTSDTNEYYTEVVCEWLLTNIDLLNSIPTITREKGYYTSTHNGVIENLNSNRSEELIAMEMFRQGSISYVGNIIDYQTPLKNKLSDEAGKIDLLSYDGKILRILELKEPESNESMLRCVIEGYTYLKTANREKLLDSFNLPLTTIIKSNPLVSIRSKQHKEMLEDRRKLKELIKTLGCEPLYYKKENNKYSYSLGMSFS